MWKTYEWVVEECFSVNFNTLYSFYTAVTKTQLDDIEDTFENRVSVAINHYIEHTDKNIFYTMTEEILIKIIKDFEVWIQKEKKNK